MAEGDSALAHRWLCALGEVDRLSIVPLFPIDVTDDARLVHIAEPDRARGDRDDFQQASRFRAEPLKPAPEDSLEVHVIGASTLSWSSTDEGTPWLALAIHLDSGSDHRVLELGRRGRSGSVALRLPPGRWRAHVVAVNSAGRLRRVPLGVLPR